MGDASPNSGASAWFIPTEPVASLSLLVKDLSAVRGDTVELWIATTAPPARPASRADSHPLAPTGVNGWLVVAGLAADGETDVSGVHHIDRGYDDLVGRLAALGASIERLP